MSRDEREKLMGLSKSRLIDEIILLRSRAIPNAEALEELVQASKDAVFDSPGAYSRLARAIIALKGS